MLCVFSSETVGMETHNAQNKEYEALNLVFETGFARVFVKDQCIIIEAKNSYIPIINFKDLFNKVGDMVDANKVNKLIFDKRNLKVRQI